MAFVDDGCFDLGDGHTAEWVGWHPDRDLNPQYADVPDTDKYGLWVAHATPEGRPCESFIIITSDVQRRIEPGRPTWQLISEDPLHVEPSLLCKTCGDHGFIRDGRWMPA